MVGCIKFIFKDLYYFITYVRDLNPLFQITVDSISLYLRVEKRIKFYRIVRLWIPSGFIIFAIEVQMAFQENYKKLMGSSKLQIHSAF